MTDLRAVNLTFLRDRARGPLPTRPGSWENFAKEVDAACDELQEYREVLSAVDREVEVAATTSGKTEPYHQGYADGWNTLRRHVQTALREGK